MTSLNTQIVRVSSDKFTSKVGETITIDIPSSVLSRAVKAIRLLDISIPYTWSNVPANANQFGFTDLAGTNTITISDHTFTPSNIIEILKQDLDANSGSGLIFTVIYHKCGGTFEFQADGSYSFDFTVPNSAASTLGFDPIVYNAVETPPASNIWVIQSVRRDTLDVDKYINVTSNLVTGVDQGVLILDGQPTPTISNILATIPIQGSAGNIIYFSESNDAPNINIQSSVLGRVASPNTDTTRSVQFGLSLDSGQSVNLNGGYWAARFLLTFL